MKGLFAFAATLVLLAITSSCCPSPHSSDAMTPQGDGLVPICDGSLPDDSSNASIVDATETDSSDGGCTLFCTQEETYDCPSATLCCCVTPSGGRICCEI